MDALDTLYSKIESDPVYDKLRQDGIKLVKGRGSSKPEIIFVGEAPGRMENALGKPFVGPAGTHLQSILTELEMGEMDIYYTNVVKYWPMINFKTETPDEALIIASRNYVLEEIDIVAEKRTIVGLCGRTAVRALFPEIKGVSAFNGTSIVGDNERVYVPLLHPAVIGYRAWKRPAVLRGYALVRNLVETYGRGIVTAN